MDVYLKCELCNGFFGDSGRWPRVLGCGHSICSLCTHLLLKDSAIICPKCNVSYPAKSPNMVPLNHTVLKLLGSPFIKSLPNLNSPEGNMQVLTALVSQTLSPESSVSQESSLGPDSSQVASSSKKPDVAAEPSHHAGICEEHGQYLLFWCNKCMEWICRDCTIVTHPHSVCPITTIRQALRDMQTQEGNLIQNTVKHFDGNVVLFRQKQQVLQGVRNMHRSLVKELQHMISLHRKADRLLETETVAIHDAMARGINMCILLLAARDRLTEATTLKEILATRLKAQEYQSAILKWFDPNLLKDSKDLLFCRELQQATEAALATMREKLVLCGYSFGENLPMPALPTSKTTTPSKGVPADAVQDIEKLLFDSSTDSRVESLPVLSPAILHKGNEVVGNEEACTTVADHDESKAVEQAIQVARKTGAIKKQPKRLIVKLKEARAQDGNPHERQPISREDIQTVSLVDGSPTKSNEVPQFTMESLGEDLQKNLMNIMGKVEASVEVKEIISRSLSIKPKSITPVQLLDLYTTEDLANLDEKLRTLLLMVTGEQETDVLKSVIEKGGNDDMGENDVRKIIDELITYQAPESAVPENAKSPDNEINKTEDLEHKDSSNKLLLSAEKHEDINKDKETKDKMEGGGDESSRVDNSSTAQVPVIEMEKDTAKTGENSVHIPDIKKGSDICKPQ